MVAATFANQLLESLSLACHTIGLDGSGQVVTSRRVVGLAAAERTRKRPLKQMLTLTVDMITALENTVVKAGSDQDAVIAGHMFFLLYARSRWSDAQSMEILELDGDEKELYIQALTSHAKTHNATRHKEDFCH
eukprot:2247969-Amphidinium_carterae.1